MVLADLGKRMTSALGQLSKASVVDDDAVESLLKELCSALLQADVNVKLVASLRTQCRQRIKKDLEAALAGSSSSAGLRDSAKKQIVQKAVYDELVALVDPKAEVFQPKRGKTSTVMMVGLQGAGKTTTISKLASHWQRKGFKVAVVAGDTFRAGALDQIRMNCLKTRTPFYGSAIESDPVVIARQGVEKFRAERFDIILIDTSGRHRQDTELFAEMSAMQDAIKPDLSILVLDGSIGQAAEAQARSFKEVSNFGAIIVTKLDGGSGTKGGGAITAAAATRAPIMFTGHGEMATDLEKFNPQQFISKLLGLGDMQGLFEHMSDIAAANPEKQKELAKRLTSGKFTLRDWREQLSSLISMGSLGKIMQSIPGMSEGGLGEEDAAGKLRRFVVILDSMTAEELDSDGTIFMKADRNGLPVSLNKRALRVARGSGTSIREIEEMLSQSRAMAGMAKNFAPLAQMGKKGAGDQDWMKAAQQMQASGNRPSPQQIAAIQKSMPPDLLRKMRAAGPAGAQRVMQEAMSQPGGGGMDLNAMMQAMGGMGGMPGMPSMPGMPDMNQMMQAMGGMGGMGGLGGMGNMLKGMMGGGS